MIAGTLQTKARTAATKARPIKAQGRGISIHQEGRALPDSPVFDQGDHQNKKMKMIA